MIRITGFSAVNFIICNNNTINLIQILGAPLEKNLG